VDIALSVQHPRLKSLLIFAVLRRQINKARKDYISTALKRHRKNKTAAADEFCMGWVMAAQRQITSTARTPEQDEAIAAYKRIHYANAVKRKQHV
jgi:hypothetical protein